MKTYYVKLIILFTACLMLTSCGFELRNNLDFPKQLQTLYISSATPYGKFEVYLKTLLSTSNINIVDEPEQSEYMLRINMHRLTQTITSISVNTQTRSFVLLYEVQYDLVRNGVTVLPTQNISLQQSYISSSSQLASESDTQVRNTIQSLQHAAAEQIISRLSAADVKKLLNKKPAVTHIQR